MFGKLAVLIVALGLIAASLLAMRQMRTQAAHELAQARLRAVRVDQDTARLRAMISTHVNPERVIEMASRSYLLKPLRGEEEAPSEASRIAIHQEPAR